MTYELNSLNPILNEIGHELDSQISWANNHINEKIDVKKITQKARELDQIVAASGLSDEDKAMLHKFSSTLVQDNATVKSLRYEKQDLERVISNINDI